jgi:class 3 adenylate cyclase
MADGWRGLGGHIYGFIIRARKPVFEEHPEYLALVDGKRQGQKFCVSNPDLRKLVVDYALERLAADPTADSVSMEPSDGGGFCECAECAKLGSISSQVVLLANEVAEAVSQQYPDKFVSILAYNYHTAPPEIRVHPRIVVTICAGQLTGSWTPNELFEAWTAQGANAAGAGFGVFEYYSNIVGNRFLPGSPRAADIAYMRRSITGFYQRGARRLRSGAAYSNGTVSLGIYLASRMLWDLKEADQLDALYADFLDKAFGAAAEPMNRYFRLVYKFEGDPLHLPLTTRPRAAVSRI